MFREEQQLRNKNPLHTVMSVSKFLSPRLLKFITS